MTPEQYRMLAGTLPPDMRPVETGGRADDRLAKFREVIGDKSGLGTLSAVSIAATLAYMAAKTREQSILMKAVRRGIPVMRNIVNPAVAFTGGVGSALTGKYLWDRYNKQDDLEWR
ncbi:MAG: hypothetical protein WC279_12915 [Sulfurimonas sp.]|jgi:hypothetical protein|uniref:hypothetical protein n=1 Tax=Sulfurimonas sp. TaxID=2022749 RepID=UPI003569C9B8